MRLLALLLLLPTLATAQGVSKFPRTGPGTRRNFAVQSNSATTGTAATAPYALYLATVATVAGAPASVGSGTWAEITGTNLTGGIVYATFTTPASQSFVGSSYVARGTGGDGTGTVAVRCGGAGLGSCLCGRSDGAACIASSLVGATDCEASATGLGTGPVRLWAIATCNSPITTPMIILYGGRAGTTMSVTRHAGVQLEARAGMPSPLCVTTTAARTCR